MRPQSRHAGLRKRTFPFQRRGQSRPLGRRLVIEPVEYRWLLAAPVAHDDHYQTVAGQILEVGQSTNTSTVELIAAGSEWNYLDDGSDQGTAWRAPGFDDNSWHSGLAELGYGDADETTVVDCGPAPGIDCGPGNPAVKFITTYFRRQFTVADRSAVQALDVQLSYDDGAIVYLNGVQIARLNMPDGPNVSYQTLAISAIEDTPTPISVANLTGSALALLATGENTIAVEIHQQAAASSDISFDLRLTAAVTSSAATGVLLNDTDADGDSLTAVLESLPDFGMVELAANGSFRYTPADDFIGQDSFTYRATNGANVSNLATVTINVTTPPNSPPVANPDEYSTPAGQVLRVGGPNDPDGTTTRTLIARGATWRYLDNGTDQGTAWRQLDFNDQSWATGPAELGYGDGDETTVVDCGPAPGSECNPGNAENKFVTTYFRRHVQIDDPSSISGIQLGVIYDDGLVVYVNGQEVVRRNLPGGEIRFGTLASAAIEDMNVLEPIVIEDVAGLFRSGDNVIAVEIHQNHPASSDISFDLELVARSIAPPPAGVLANDTDANGDTLTALLASPPGHGTVQLASDGSLVYSPAAGFVGDDSFTYRASDGIVASNVATVTIHVTSDGPANQPPVARDDFYAVERGHVLIVGGPDLGLAGVLANDTDADGDILTAVLITPPQHGTLELRPNGSFTYDSDDDFAGVDTFTYQADHGDARSNTATVTLAVGGPATSNPIARDDRYETNFYDRLAVDVIDPPGSLAVDESPGAARLTLSKHLSGGRVETTGPIDLGAGAGNRGAALIEDAGTRWIDTSWLAVGANDGHGTLTIADGAQVSGANWTQIGAYRGTGIVTVSGPGSRLDTANFLSVGEYDGRGRLVVADGASVNVGNWTEVGRSNAYGELTITGQDSRFSTQQFFHVGGGGQGVVTIDAGATLAAGSLIVEEEGLLQGAGLIRSNVQNRAIIRPGMPRGVLSVLGSFTQVASGALEFEIGGHMRGGGYDALDVTGSATIGGRVVVRFVDGFAPTAGDRFDLVVASSVSSALPTLQVHGLADGYQLNLSREGGRLVLIAQNDAVALPVAPPLPQVGILANDESSSGTPLAPVLVEGPAHGTLELYVNGSFIYTPGEGFSGDDSFRYRVTDGFTYSEVATVEIVDTNATPLAADDSYHVPNPADTPGILTVAAADGVLANDQDPNGDSLIAELVTAPQHGALQLAPNGSFVYTADAEFTGVDRFIYRAFDGVDYSSPATVSISVRSAENAPPVAVDDACQTMQGVALVVEGDGCARYPDPVFFDDFESGAAAAWSNRAVSSTPVGNRRFLGEFAAQEVALSIDDLSNHSAVTVEFDLFIMKSWDGNGDDYWRLAVDGGPLLLNTTFAISPWREAEHPRQSYPDPYPADHPWGTGAVEVKTLGYDFIGDTVYHLKFAFEHDSDALVLLFSASGLSGVDNESWGLDNVRVSVSGPAPTQAGVLANDSDADGDSLTAILESGPEHGELTLNADGTFTYVPEPHFFGTDRFVYRASDGFASTPATVTIVVEQGPDQPPVAQPDHYTLTVGPDTRTLVVSTVHGVLRNDHDPNGDSLSARLVDEPSHGVVDLGLNGGFVYTANADFVGVDTFYYRAMDGGDNVSPATSVTIEVRSAPPANRRPVAEHDHYQLNVRAGNETLVVSTDDGVLDNDSDPDGDSLAATLFSSPAHGHLEFAADGSFTYRPDAGFEGIDTFSYRAVDPAGAVSELATANIIVSQFDPPFEEIRVSTTDDELDDDHSAGDLSLREAVRLANASDGQRVRIVVPAGYYRLTIEGRGEDNAATGDLDIETAAGLLQIVGAGADTTTIDANGIDRAFHILGSSASVIELEAMTLRGGQSPGEPGVGIGGAIANHGSLVVRNVVVTQNHADQEGGGIYTDSKLTIEESQILANEAFAGAGVMIAGANPITTGVNILRTTLADNVATYSGGGLFAVNARLVVRDSTVSGNRSVEHGGGLEFWNNTETTVLNSTISGNYSERLGGGIHNNDDVQFLFVENSTITANRVGLDGFGGGLATETSTTLRNSIVAGNLDGDTADDVAGHFQAASRYNLIGVIDGSTGLTDFTSHNRFGSLASGPLDPRLGPLLDNGGPTKTHAILPGSVALDGGDPNFDPTDFSPDLVSDQRGLARVADVSCRPDRDAPCGPIVIVDIGAYELQPTDPVPSPGDFNGDRGIDAADIDLLMDVVRRASSPPRVQVAAGAPLAWEISVFDLTGDSVVDHSDADYLIQTMLETAYGDVDLDGRVGLRDLMLLRSGLGTPSAGWADGDLNGDAVVDRLDLALVSANLGYQRGVAMTAAAPQAAIQQARSALAGRRSAHDAVFARDAAGPSVRLAAARRSITAQIADEAIAQTDAADSRFSTLSATRRRSPPRREPS
jgi:T5SS/PEP-CTERM-associated repeat protein/predicted outer membrane repeat protein